MFEGETADCLALANTAILMRVIEQLVGHGPDARALLRDAISDLESCPNASRTEDAIKIIRKELMPRYGSDTEN
jgi:hypothetical protein